jgi:hypothetical protein
MNTRRSIMSQRRRHYQLATILRIVGEIEDGCSIITQRRARVKLAKRLQFSIRQYQWRKAWK